MNSLTFFEPKEKSMFTKTTRTSYDQVMQIFIKTTRPVKNSDGSIYAATVTLDVSPDETIASVMIKYMDMECNLTPDYKKLK